MIEWKTLWKDIADGAMELQKLTGEILTVPESIDLSIKACGILYQHNAATAKKTYAGNSNPTDDKPTEKQLNYAKKLGVSGTESMTKGEISKAIEAKLKEQQPV